VRIVMLSTHDATWLILQTVELGAAGYVVKDENAFDKILSLCETTLI
jgi:DNA-binding NarL/FixJ family response regulator